MANDYLFANLLFFVSKEGNRVMLPSCATTNMVIDASNILLEALIATYQMQRLVNESTFSLTNNNMFANLLFLTNTEDDRVMLPSCTTVIVAIDASSTSLEAVIGTYDMHGDGKGEHFANGKQLHVYQSFVFYKKRGIQGNVSPFFNCICDDESF